MRALLLAAGLGTRLQPLTQYIPKCLVPIRGRPLLDYWIEALVRDGIHKILINTHYLAPLVYFYLERSSWMPWITLVDENQLLGTGGTLLKNRKYFNEEQILVAHADNLTVFDAGEFLKSHLHRPAQTLITMMVFRSDDPQSCGIVELDTDSIVRRFHEKVASPPGNLANAAVYIFEPAIFETLDNRGKAIIDLSTEIIPELVGRIHTYTNSNYHRDIGTIESWRIANQTFPLRPASPQNAHAWAATCAHIGNGFEEKMQRLLENRAFTSN